MHVVVVGAGLSGLAAALHLAGAGVEVTVLERADHPGGRVGRHCFDDYEIDSGATILTMPELIDEALAAVGSDRESAAVPLRLHQLTPAYRARFADGSALDVLSDPDAMADQIARACGRADVDGYRALRQWLARLYEAEYDTFLDTDFDSVLDLVSTPRARRDLARLVRLGGFGALGRKVASFLDDPRLRRLFTFQALFAGTAPKSALAVYGAIPYMDACLGVWFPAGGMRAIPRTLAAAFTAAGGILELNTEVTDVAPGRVRTADGRVIAADAVVVTADLGSHAGLGLPGPRRGLRPSPSAVVAHGTVPAAVAAQWPVQAHHTLDFGAAWDETFADITARRGRLMRDPSLLLTRPALSDAGLLVRRGDVAWEPQSLLAPCPNLAAAPLDWSDRGLTYLRELLGVLESRGYRGIADGFRVDHLETPQTWAAAGMLAGTPFSAAHLFRQTGPFRPRNRLRGRPDVVLAGCGTTPGVGVPTALLSGKHAAARLLTRTPGSGFMPSTLGQ